MQTGVFLRRHRVNVEDGGPPVMFVVCMETSSETSIG